MAVSVAEHICSPRALFLLICCVCKEKVCRDGEASTLFFFCTLTLSLPCENGHFSYVSGKIFLPVQIIPQHTLQHTKSHTIEYSFQKHKFQKKRKFYSKHKNSTKSYFRGMLIKTRMKKHDIYKKNINRENLKYTF